MNNAFICDLLNFTNLQILVALYNYLSFIYLSPAYEKKDFFLCFFAILLKYLDFLVLLFSQPPA